MFKNVVFEVEEAAAYADDAPRTLHFWQFNVGTDQVASVDLHQGNVQLIFMPIDKLRDCIVNWGPNLWNVGVRFVGFELLCSLDVEVGDLFKVALEKNF